MLIHTIVGHPTAAILARLGCSRAAQAAHRATLPTRVRESSSTAFDERADLFWIDFFFLPLASLLWHCYCDWAATRIFVLGPWEIARAAGTCGYYPYVSGGVPRATEHMTAHDIGWKIIALRHEGCDVPKWITAPLCMPKKFAIGDLINALEAAEASDPGFLARIQAHFEGSGPLEGIGERVRGEQG